MKKRKIFVTVGSTKFDELVQVIDEIAKDSKFEVSFQIGRGEYIPKNGKWFRYDPNIRKWYKWADIVVCIDSAGTLFENLELGKKIIAVRNWEKIDVSDLGEKLSKDKYIMYINTSNRETLRKKLISYLNQKLTLKKYEKPKCEIPRYITALIG